MRLFPQTCLKKTLNFLLVAVDLVWFLRLAPDPRDVGGFEVHSPNLLIRSSAVEHFMPATLATILSAHLFVRQHPTGFTSTNWVPVENIRKVFLVHFRIFHVKPTKNNAERKDPTNGRHPKKPAEATGNL